MRKFINFVTAVVICLVLSIVILIGIGVTASLLANRQTPAKDPLKSPEIVELKAKLAKAYRLIELTYGVTLNDLTYGKTPVTVSAYTARAAECDETPHFTADMTPSRVGVLAVSRDMLSEIGLRMGETVLLIEGGEPMGVFQVRDKMAGRWTRRVDILHGNVEAAKAFGIHKNVTLVKIIGRR